LPGCAPATAAQRYLRLVELVVDVAPAVELVVVEPALLELVLLDEVVQPEFWNVQPLPLEPLSPKLTAMAVQPRPTLP